MEAAEDAESHDPACCAFLYDLRDVFGHTCCSSQDFSTVVKPATIGTMNPNRLSLLTLVFVLAAMGVVVPRGLTVCAHTLLRDIEYATVDGVSLLLDLYLPDVTPTETVPLVIWVHGGGWRAGSKDQTIAPSALGEDYAIASVEYRLSDVAVFPAQIHDVKAAVRWLRAHAHDYGFDPQRFGAWGSSAGGHLVTLLGVSCGNEDLEGTVGDYLDESSCVQAVCDFYGPTDFSSIMEQRGVGPLRRPLAEDLLLGGAVEDLVALAELASPIAHVSASSPPFLVMHGAEDSTVPVEQSIAFDAALHAEGVDSTLVVIAGAGHGFPREHLTAVKPWFDAHLRDLKTANEGDLEAVAAFHHRGQTYLTWSEGTFNWFAIYRADHKWISKTDLRVEDRLAIIPKGSSINERASAVENDSLTYVIRDGERALTADTGLFVTTPMSSGDATYAIASCTQVGEELEWIGTVGPVAERVGVPVPVLQSTSTVKGCRRTHYVHGGPYQDTPVFQALVNRPNQAFNVVIWEPAERRARHI